MPVHLGGLFLLPYTTGVAARMWWMYATRALLKRLSKGRMSWPGLQRAAMLRKAYIPAYARAMALRLGGGSDPVVVALDAGVAAGREAGLAPVGPATKEQVSAAAAAAAALPEIQAMDAQLEQGTIVLFRWVYGVSDRVLHPRPLAAPKPQPAHPCLLVRRRMAHARAQNLARIAAAAAQSAAAGSGSRGAAARGRASSGTPASSGTWASWLGLSAWYTSAPAAPPRAGTAPPPGALPGGGEGVAAGPSALSSEEWARLEALLAEQVGDSLRTNFSSSGRGGVSAGPSFYHDLRCRRQHWVAAPPSCARRPSPCVCAHPWRWTAWPCCWSAHRGSHPAVGPPALLPRLPFLWLMLGCRA